MNNQIAKPVEADPKPRSSRITTTLKVEGAEHYIYVSDAGMQLGSVAPVHVRPEDFELYHALFGFAIGEWKRAKAIEIVVNQPNPHRGDITIPASLTPST